jgi:hypothetical protein
MSFNTRAKIAGKTFNCRFTYARTKSTVKSTDLEGKM